LDKIPDFYDRLGRSYDERFYEQEVMGNYLAMETGRVYPAFNRHDHITGLPVDPISPLRWSLDFNVDPMCSVVVQLMNGKVRVLDEIVLRHATTNDACKAFLDRYGAHRAGVYVYGDASGYQSQTSGATDYQMIEDYFAAHAAWKPSLRTLRKNPPVRERVNLMNKLLRSASGNVGVLIDSRCKELIKDFEEVCYKSETNQIDKERDRRRTHLSDALGYLVWQECIVQPPIGEQQWGRIL
jgi:hypothetical protein